MFIHIPKLFFMSEEDIEGFISVTTSSRRCAIWFITHNSDLNEAVESFYENGEASIPDDFDPEHEEGTDFECEEEEYDAEPNSMLNLDLLFEPEEQPLSPFQIQIEDAEIPVESPQQIIKKKIAEGSKLTYVLQNPGNTRLCQESNLQQNKKYRFKPRNNSAKSVPFVVWKNGYSIGNIFTKKTANEMEGITKKISFGSVPGDIKDFNDIQLVDRSSENYDPSFDSSQILVF